jgi:hypothetical protein
MYALVAEKGLPLRRGVGRVDVWITVFRAVFEKPSSVAGGFCWLRPEKWERVLGQISENNHGRDTHPLPLKRECVIMKRYALLVIALSAVLSSTLSCVSTKTMVLCPDEMANVEVIGAINTKFTSFQWFNFYSKKGIGKKAYNKLKRKAQETYVNNKVDVVNVVAKGKFSLGEVVMIYFIVTPALGNFQKIHASGDVISTDGNAVAARQTRPLNETSVPKTDNASFSLVAAPTGQRTAQEMTPAPEPYLAGTGQTDVEPVTVEPPTQEVTPAPEPYLAGAGQTDAEPVTVEPPTQEVTPAPKPHLAGTGQTDVEPVTAEPLHGLQEKICDTDTQKSRKRLSAGAGFSSTLGYGGGIEWANGARVTMPYTAYGGHVFVDFIYYEAFAGWSYGAGKWQSASASNSDKLPDMRRTYINFGILMKCPIGERSVRFAPIVGFDYELSTYGELLYSDGHWSKLGNRSDLSALCFIVGGGLDVDLGKNTYLRSELLWSDRREVYRFERDNVEMEKAYSKGVESVDGGAGILKLGIGYKF